MDGKSNRPSSRSRGLRRLAATGLIAGLSVTLAAVPAQAAEAQAVSATVANTGGQLLFARSAPNTGGSIVHELSPGESVDVECQVESQDINGNNVWNYLPAIDGYASDFYLDTGQDGRHSELPLCEGEEQPPADDMREQISSIAQGEVGVTDKSKYGAPPDHAWCQYFVNWVWGNAGVGDILDSPFTGDFYHWGVERGLTRDGHDNIQVGDAVLFGTGPENPQTSTHVGIVVAVHGDGSIETVDGNYDNRVARVGPYFPESAETHEPGNVYAVVSPPA